MPGLVASPSPVVPNGVLTLNCTGFSSGESRTVAFRLGGAEVKRLTTTKASFTTTIKAPAVVADYVIEANGMLGCAKATFAVRVGVEPPPPPPPTPSVRVTSIDAMLTAMLNNNVVDITLAAGRYPTGRIWIGKDIAKRTNPLIVRSENDGVILDGKSATYCNMVRITEGAHDIRFAGKWSFDNGRPDETGIIVYGAAQNTPVPYNITWDWVNFMPGLTGRNPKNDHGVYFSWCAGHDLVFSKMTGVGHPTTPMSSAFHADHGDAASPNASRVTLRNFDLEGFHQTIILWTPPLTDWLLEDGNIRKSLECAVRYETAGANNIFRRVVSTGSPGGKGLIHNYYGGAKGFVDGGGNSFA